MPTYEYLCSDCGKTFEATQKITEDPLKECQLCGGKNVKRLISATAFHLKGGGWYKTDYASGSSSGTGGKSTASETKSESSSEAPKTEPAKSEPAPTTPATPTKSE